MNAFIILLLCVATAFAPVVEREGFVKEQPSQFTVTATVMTCASGGPELSGGVENDADYRVFVALPSKEALGKKVSVTCLKTGKTIRNVPVRDIGPWSIRDAYWTQGKRPMAESGKSDKYGVAKNSAGIDLSLKLARELGLKYPFKGKVVWYFEEDEV